MARLGMLIDLTRCIGCDACTVACKQENGTPADVFFARVLNIEAGSFPDVRRVYLPVLCNHCEDPACLKACPNKAIFKREDGIVLIDEDRCRGTGACVSACPYGNIILKPEDKWYLPEDEPYETQHVKERIKPGVARKCTLCAHRVDDGLDPACVVACPTTARIFGDLDDEDSRISRYIRDQEEQTGRSPFHLLPEAGTKPTMSYLSPMAAQKTIPLEDSVPESIRARGRARAEQPREAVAAALAEEPAKRPGVLERVARAVGISLTLLLLVFTARAGAVEQTTGWEVPEVWSNSSCAGCHGASAMGGLGPPLAGTTLSQKEFHDIVRKGRGMMPAIPASEVPDGELASIFDFTRKTKLDPTQIPFSYKVGAYLTPGRVGVAFGLIALLSVLLALKVLAYWLGNAGLSRLMPALKRLGYGRSAGIALKSLIVDGFLVSSLWRANKHRWAMHALLIYGFTALGLADLLMSIFNPTRGGLPFTHPIRLLANIGGVAVLLGIAYVRVRYAKDEYIDNGVTIGRDYLFLNLLTWTILTGFMVEILRAAGQAPYVQPAYMLHLGLVAVLFVTAPFTRFQHVFVVPALVAMTRLTNAVTAGGYDMGLVNEPAPGRDHKSRRIAEGLLRTIDPDFDGKVRIRYFP